MEGLIYTSFARGRRVSKQYINEGSNGAVSYGISISQEIDSSHWQSTTDTDNVVEFSSSEQLFAEPNNLYNDTTIQAYVDDNKTQTNIIPWHILLKSPLWWSHNTPSVFYIQAAWSVLITVKILPFSTCFQWQFYDVYCRVRRLIMSTPSTADYFWI